MKKVFKTEYRSELSSTDENGIKIYESVPKQILYFEDERGNSWSSELVDEEIAIEMSKSLIDCYNCKNSRNLDNCINCDQCFDCDNCINCFDCENCKNCIHCVTLKWCDHCIHCRELSNEDNVTKKDFSQSYEECHCTCEYPDYCDCGI